MKIIIADSIQPFSANHHSFSIPMQSKLRDAGHTVDTVLLPFSGQAGSSLEELFGFSLLNLTGVADLLVCLSMPSLFVRHPNKLFFSDLLEWPQILIKPDEVSREKTKQIIDYSRIVSVQALKSVRKAFLGGQSDVDWVASHTKVEVGYVANWKLDFLTILRSWLEQAQNPR